VRYHDRVFQLIPGTNNLENKQSPSPIRLLKWVDHMIMMTG
jgi:hypothetical protein